MSYKDKFYKKYASTHTESLYGKISKKDIESNFKIWQSYFSKFLPPNKEVRILDLGCGNGGFVYWLEKVGYKNVEGVDVSEEQINAARKLGTNKVVQGEAGEFLKDKEEFYDIIFARDFLEHLSKNELLGIGEAIHKSLKKDGVFVAQTVNAENLLWGRLRHGDFTHDLAFTKESISQFLKVVGFSEVRVYPQRPVVHGLKSFIRYILWRLIEIWSMFYLLVETGSPRGIFTQNIIVKALK